MEHFNLYKKAQDANSSHELAVSLKVPGIIEGFWRSDIAKSTHNANPLPSASERLLMYLKSIIDMKSLSYTVGEMDELTHIVFSKTPSNFNGK